MVHFFPEVNFSLLLSIINFNNLSDYDAPL